MSAGSSEVGRLLTAAATEGELPRLDYGDLLDWNVAVRPDATAVVLDDRSVTFRELHRMTLAASSVLRGRGIAPGDRIGLLGANTMEWLALSLGGLVNGVSVVPFNARYSPAEITALVARAELKLLLAQPRFGRKDLSAYLGELSESQSVAVATIVDSVPGLDHANVGETAAAAAKSIGAHAHEVGTIMYTSGSTSAPKGCMLAQSGMIRNAALHTQRLGITSSDVWFSPMPLYHAGGFVWGVTSMLVTGATLVSQQTFDAARAIDLVEATQATYHHGVDTMFISEMESPAFDHARMRSLRIANSTGGRPVLERIHREMGVPGIVSKWGITEGYGNLTLSSPDDELETRLETVGRGYPGIEYRIDPVTTSGTGEILIRSSVMDGYFRDADSTAATVDPDGWLHTGDLGWFDSDGFLHYVGRSKQMLKVGGENVSALEVEGVLLTYPGVTAASVIGVGHPRLGEVPIAVVEATTPERELADRLMQHCHDRLARFKVPAEIVVVAPGEFPLTGSGKADAAGVRRLLEARS